MNGLCGVVDVFRAERVFPPGHIQQHGAIHLMNPLSIFSLPAFCSWEGYNLCS
jgi:hypothetical protein